jgi:hypothetical protein
MLNRQKQNNIIKGFINFMIFSLVIGGLVLLMSPKNIWPSFYSPVFFGVNALISAIILILPKYLFRSDNNCKQIAVQYLRLALAALIFLNALGELYLYQLYVYHFQYDKVLHLVSPIFMFIGLSYFMQNWYGTPFKKSLWISGLILLSGGVLWEVFEFFSDILFKTQEFGIYGQYKLPDTLFDLLFDLLGVVFGTLYMNPPAFLKKHKLEECTEQISTDGIEFNNK